MHVVALKTTKDIVKVQKIVIAMIVITVLAGQKNVRLLKDLVQVILGKEEQKL